MNISSNYNNISCAAIIVAGGNGLRMNSAVPKQFMLLKGKPVLYYSIRAFLNFNPAIKIILVLPAEHISYSNMVLQCFKDRIDMIVVSGGSTRFHSVQNGINALGDEEIVFIHDGVRPFINNELLQRCFETAVNKGNAIPCIDVSDSIRRVNKNNSEYIDRETLRAIQTPQTFSSVIIQKAFEQGYQPAFTDEATVIEHDGEKVCLVEGNKNNIKITTPEDLIIAAAILENVSKQESET